MAAHLARDRVAKTWQRLDLLAERVDVLAHRAIGRFPRHGTPSSAPLDDLGRGWQHIDDIQWPGKSFANVDHVLVGPPGVFVVENRRWSKGIDLSDAATHDEAAQKEMLHGIATAAHAVGSLLGMTHRRPIPIVCFAGGGDIDTSIGNVMACSTSNIVARLEAMPDEYDATQVRAIAEQVRTRLLPATGRLGAIPAQRIR